MVTPTRDLVPVDIGTPEKVAAGNQDEIRVSNPGDLNVAINAPVSQDSMIDVTNGKGEVSEIPGEKSDEAMLGPWMLVKHKNIRRGIKGEEVGNGKSNKGKNKVGSVGSQQPIKSNAAKIGMLPLMSQIILAVMGPT